MDASDRIRKINGGTIFAGYADQKRVTQPGVNVSTCATFYTSTINQFQTYDYKQSVVDGRVYFSTLRSQS